MKLHLKIASILLNFILTACFAPSMFGSDECMFKFDEDEFPTSSKESYSNGGELDDLYDGDATALRTIDTSASQLVTYKRADPQIRLHGIDLDLDAEGIFDFELTDKTPSASQLVTHKATAQTYSHGSVLDLDDTGDDYDRHSTDSDGEESDEDISGLNETDQLHTCLTVAKSTAIVIKPRQRSQSDLIHVKPKGKQRERSGSDPIAIPSAKPKLSDKAEDFSLGLHTLYEEYDYKNKRTLTEYPLFSSLLEISKSLTKQEMEIVLSSLPRDSYSSFIFKIELGPFLMGNQTTMIRAKKAPRSTHNILPKSNKLLIML